MRKKVVISLIVAGALVLAGIAGVVAYQPVSAAVQQVKDTVAGGAPVTAGAWMDDIKGWGPGGGYTQEDLAKALGISVDDLTKAQTKAKEAILAQAVKDGKITQAQADEILKGTSKTKGFFFNWKSVDYDKYLAEALGITVEKLNEAYQKAYFIRLDQLVTDGKLTKDQADLAKAKSLLASNAKFQSAQKAAYEAAIKQAVADGVITQAQADLLLKEQTSFRFPGFGMPGMKGRGGAGFMGIPDKMPRQNSDPNSAPRPGKGR
ncbi:MAG TPA: hypothetical protein VIO61_02050 [Anaerolineaceae bacterium]